MKVVETYSFKKGEEFIMKYHPEELAEVISAINNLDAIRCLTKASSEKTKTGKLLFSPPDLNYALKTVLAGKGWVEKIDGKKGFKEPRIGFGKGRFRAMDGLKKKVGLEIQFGKYAFVGYDIFSKMVIFNKHGLIDCGIEIIPAKGLSKHLSTGGSNLDQVLIELIERGESDLDIPVFIISIAPPLEEERERERIQKLFATNDEEVLKILNLKKYNGVLPGPKKKF